MSKTLLQAINEVAKNVRLNLGTFTASNYNTLFDPVVVTQFINVAKQQVEDAWDWERLITRVVFDTVASQHEYDTASGGAELISGNTNERSRIVKERPSQRAEFWLVDSGLEQRVQVVDSGRSRHIKEVETSSVSRPLWVSAYQNGDGLTILFPLAPSGVHRYAFNAIVPQDDLTSDSTTISAPWRPIVLKATELLLAERGEELGLNLDIVRENYENALSFAIGQEMGIEDQMLTAD